MVVSPRVSDLMLKQIIATVCGLVVAAVTLAQPHPQQVAKITAADAAVDDRFARSVSISGDTAIVGATFEDDGGVNSGSAYIFERGQGGPDNWGQVAKIIAADAAANDRFGIAASLNGNTAIVGADLDDDGGVNSGSAYIFERDQGGFGNWGQVVKITAADAAAGDQFGISVALDGDTAVVGAFSDDDGGNQSGSVYVFERHQGGLGNWGQVAKITAADAAAGDSFGISVSLSGDTVIVGADANDDGGISSGSAYIFERDQGGLGNWGQVAKITAADAAAEDQFGDSVSLSGNIAIVGARFDDDGGPNSGSAYIFERHHGGPDHWGQVAKITAADATADDFFGESVSLSGHTAIVGAVFDDDGGSAYIFERDQGGSDNWGQVAKFTADVSIWFGVEVSLSGDTAIVGDLFGDGTGTAYIFRSETNTVELLYASDDRGNRDTQALSIDLASGNDTSLGPLQAQADLETLIVEAGTGNLYGITAETGDLWRIDTATGALTLACTIDTVRKFREIAASSYHPSTGELWVYQWNKGLYTLDLSTCALTQQWRQPHVAGIPSKWDGLAWKPDATVLFGSQRSDLYRWDPVLETATVLCSNLPDKTEGLEHNADGRLLGSSGSKIYEINPDTCTVTELLNLPDREDIESLAVAVAPIR